MAATRTAPRLNPRSRAQPRTWRGTRWRLLLPFLLLSLQLPGAASAATVSVGGSVVGALSEQLRFDAAAGEANRVTIEVAGSEATVRDSAAPLTPGAGCSSLDAHSARCTNPFTIPSPPAPQLIRGRIDVVVAELGDRDDALAASFPAAAPGQPSVGPLVVDGGAGDDVLDASRAQITTLRPAVELGGGPGRDTLTGGPGHDWLLGGPDADVLRGGADRDELSGDGPWHTGPRGRDLIDGGPGTDRVNYTERLAPVVVDLKRGRGGRRGERDRLRAIEDIGGGLGRDRLYGDDRANLLTSIGPFFSLPLPSAHGSTAFRLSSTPPMGGDVLVGRGGNDELHGPRRGAQLDGGPGNDLLGRATRRFPFACGPGSDTLGAESGLLIPRDCEWLGAGDGSLSRGAVRGGRAHFRLRRPYWVGDRGCVGSVSLGSPRGKRYGGGSWPARGRERRIWFGLNAAGRKAARRHRIAVVQAGCRGQPASSWRIRL